ncbi:MAG: HAMP domain-containing histidine kinase [Dorea sp.]|nr:HAMP domain-containing histidine kinase [Dorea sp.]
MFPEFQKKLVRRYTLSTGVILTFILAVTFLYYLSSQQSRMEVSFSDHIFTLTSKLQTESAFNDSYLAQLESKHRLLIYIEENNTPFFFPGVYSTRTDRQILLNKTQKLASSEGIFPNSHPISSDLLQSSVLTIKGKHCDSYLGCVTIVNTSSGYQKLILLQDITENKIKLIQNAALYLLIDILGILLLFLTGKRFVSRSLKPLEEMYAKQQDFTAAASHELRSPLSVIRAAADAASINPIRHEKFLAVIKDECRRGDSLIKNLLLLSSAREESWSMKMQRFELDEMLLHLTELYEPLCGAKNGSLLLSLPEETLPPVYADPELCLQIFTILLDNAIAYGLKDTGRIVLNIKSTPARIVASVTDFGPGISDKDKPLIFDAFYRQDQSRNVKSHFGLGLSIAARLAKLQDITLNVRDTEGGGSTFDVIFNR